MNHFDTMIRALAEAPPARPELLVAYDATSSRTDRLLYLLDCNACLATSELASAIGLTSKQVWGLLKSRLARGEVRFLGGLWSLNPDFEQPVVAAVRLLRAPGWTVEPPEVG
ncbi:MAG: hypothetical protein ACK44A_05405 [Roseateles sp.]